MLTFLLFAILGFYLLGIAGKYFLRRWILKKQREFAENGGQGGFRTYTRGTGGGSGQERPEREGDVSIQQTKVSRKRVNTEIGDYVEYEDIEVVITEKED